MNNSNENKPFNAGRLIPVAGAAAVAFLLGTSPLSANSEVTAGTGVQAENTAEGQTAGAGALGEDLAEGKTAGTGVQAENTAEGQTAGAGALGEDLVEGQTAGMDASGDSLTKDPADGAEETSRLYSSLQNVPQSPESIAEECRKLLTYSAAVSDLSGAEDAETLHRIGESLAGLGDFMDAPELAGECIRRADYADATTLMKDEVEPEILYAAMGMLESLGDYKDAAALATDCSQKVMYADALSLMDNQLSRESLEKATESFKALGDYMDSAEKAAECADMLKVLTSYESALSDMEKEKYAKAEKAFTALGDFSDSGEMARICRIMKKYKKAADLYDAGEYKKAHLAFKDLLKAHKKADAVVTARGEVSASYLRTACLNERRLIGVQKRIKEGLQDEAIEMLRKIEWSYLTEESQELLLDISEQLGEETVYDKAVRYYNEGSYYEAYKSFLDCGGAKDSDLMAEKCIQPFPEAGLAYESKDYADRSAQLTIDNTGFMNAYYKLYFGENLVMTVFIPENEKVTFTLPAGSYKMKKAYGDLWFGTEDLFGDEGFYWNCLFGEGKDTAVIQSGYGYAIVSGDDGTGIGTKATERGDF